MDAGFLPSGPCFFCHADSTTYICNSCQQDLFFTTRTRCPVCALPSSTDRICGRCLLSPPAFDLSIVLTDYCYPFDRYLQALKYRHRPELMRLPASSLASTIRHETRDLPDVLIPVPLHASRQRQRGYNQADLLSRHLGRQLGIKVINNAIVRCRATASQSGLSHVQRRRNMRNAFIQRNPLGEIRVAICDDVITTGATVNELAKVLVANGCPEVQVWALARTPP